jgi:hypothetical protein
MSPNDDIGIELTLLIDPCNDPPESYLGFDFRGEIFALDDNVVGKATIDICHLKRKRLRAARLKVIRATIELMKLMRDLTAKGNDRAARAMQKWADQHLAADSCYYAAAAREVMNHPEAFGL